MFGDFHGLPVHALVVHAAVTLTPLAAVLALACLVPRWRRWLRIPALVVSALAVVTLLVTRQSGLALQSALGSEISGTPVGAAIDVHQAWANRLVVASVVLLVVVGIGLFAWRAAGSRSLSTAASVAVAIVALGVVVLTVETGEAGATAVWNPTGSVSYASP